MSGTKAQADLLEAWSADQHMVWEITWPAAPIAGPITVESWRVGSRYRFEILEATAPALVGETLIFDGQTAWRYNRFDALPPAAASPTLAPISEAFAQVNQLLVTPPATASQENSPLNQRPTHKITLTFANEEALTFWRDKATGLPIRIIFTIGPQSGQLQARSFERLDNPPPGLFER